LPSEPRCVAVPRRAPRAVPRLVAVPRRSSPGLAPSGADPSSDRDCGWDWFTVGSARPCPHSSRPCAGQNRCPRSSSYTSAIPPAIAFAASGASSSEGLDPVLRYPSCRR
jgi:hypothetical protein